MTPDRIHDVVVTAALLFVVVRLAVLETRIRGMNLSRPGRSSSSSGQPSR